MVDRTAFQPARGPTDTQGLYVPFLLPVITSESARPSLERRPVSAIVWTGYETGYPMGQAGSYRQRITTHSRRSADACRFLCRFSHRGSFGTSRLTLLSGR